MKAKWPAEWLGFRRKGMSFLYEAIGFRHLTCFEENQELRLPALEVVDIDTSSECVWHSFIALEDAIPLTPAAREFLAIAKEQGEL